MREAKQNFEVKLPNAGGYELHLRSSGHRGVVLSAFRPGALATYTAPGQWDETGIEADFGPFGEVNLHFAAEPKREEKGPSSQAACPVIPKSVTLSGPVIGSFQFQGENDFVSLEATQLHGTYVRQPRIHCTPRAKHAAAVRPKRDLPRPNYTSFVARGPAGPRTALLYGLGLPKSDTDSVWAVIGATKQTVEGVLVADTAFEIEDSGAVLPIPSLAKPKMLTVAPRSPFTGNATMHLRPHQPPSWSGSLGVELPGEGRIQLTGPGFQAAFCHSLRKREGGGRCLRLLAD